jgi:transposase
VKAFALNRFKKLNNNLLVKARRMLFARNLTQTEELVDHLMEDVLQSAYHQDQDHLDQDHLDQDLDHMETEHHLEMRLIALPDQLSGDRNENLHS